MCILCNINNLAEWHRDKSANKEVVLIIHSHLLLLVQVARTIQETIHNPRSTVSQSARGGQSVLYPTQLVPLQLYNNRHQQICGFSDSDCVGSESWYVAAGCWLPHTPSDVRRCARVSAERMNGIMASHTHTRIHTLVRTHVGDTRSITLSYTLTDIRMKSKRCKAIDDSGTLKMKIQSNRHASEL